MKKELIIYTDPKSPISEIFRTLRTNILFMDTNEDSKTILLTSTLPGEGKSWMSSNLATAFAQTGKKIILIDSDMRKGRQYSIFGVSPTPGLSNYLTGVDINESIKKEKDLKHYIQKTEIENLDVMTAGNVPPNPSELLSSKKMTNLLQEVKKLYDIVIIDGTPCQLVADSLILSRIVDSTIIVASHKSTKKKDLERVITSINNVGGKIFGVILNKVPIPIKKYQQSYYYSSNSENKKDKEINNLKLNSLMADIKNKIKLKMEKEKVDEKKEPTKSDKKEKVDEKKEPTKSDKKEKVDEKKKPTKSDKKEKVDEKKEPTKSDKKEKVDEKKETTKSDKKEKVDEKKEATKKDKNEKIDAKKETTKSNKKEKVTSDVNKIVKQETTSKRKRQSDMEEDFTKIEKVEKVELLKDKKRRKNYVVKKEIVVPLFEEIMRKA